MYPCLQNVYNAVPLSSDVENVADQLLRLQDFPSLRGMWRALG